jgi:predicted nucleic acid-binding protein
VTFGLDSSVVLRLLTGEPAAQARAAIRWLREVKTAGGTAVISDLVASEVYFALQYHYGVPKAEALQQLGLFLASGDVRADGEAAEVLATPRLASAKPGFVDRLIHQQYRRARVTAMVTFERAARGLPQVRLLEGDSASA